MDSLLTVGQGFTAQSRIPQWLLSFQKGQGFFRFTYKQHNLLHISSTSRLNNSYLWCLTTRILIKPSARPSSAVQVETEGVTHFKWRLDFSLHAHSPVSHTRCVYPYTWPRLFVATKTRNMATDSWSHPDAVVEQWQTFLGAIFGLRTLLSSLRFTEDEVCYPLILSPCFGDLMTTACLPVRGVEAWGREGDGGK